jgi:peptidoglycan hydrolase-like protein with peptidoglycan-binding domain
MIMSPMRPLARVRRTPLALTPALTLAVALTLTVGPAGPSLAAGRRAVATPSVTLHASAILVTFGEHVSFSGKIRPPSPGQTVKIVDQHGRTIAHPATRADGTYKTSAVPRTTVRVHAQWNAISSKRVKVRVRPRLAAHWSSPVRLFDTTTVTGRLAPWNPGKRIDVTLYQAGTRVLHVGARLGHRGRFTARVPIEHAGTQHVVVSFTDPDFAPAVWRSGTATPPLPYLQEGSSGIFVQLLQSRLIQLHYHVAAKDGQFDYRLADSVMAFHKVQGMSRTTTIDVPTWQALASPKMPGPRDRSRGAHFEVDLTKQVVYYVVDARIASIFHVSSGKPSTPTYPGRFHVGQKEPGYNQKQMYYSSFFDGNRAMHGYADVPSYAASHGCVRMPIWSAKWVYARASLGMLVYVYN